MIVILGILAAGIVAILQPNTNSNTQFAITNPMGQKVTIGPGNHLIVTRVAEAARGMDPGTAPKRAITQLHYWVPRNQAGNPRPSNKLMPVCNNGSGSLVFMSQDELQELSDTGHLQILPPPPITEESKSAEAGS